MLHPDGRLMTENLRKARATDYYVLRGDRGGETYTPRFTFHGFQYVEVTGYPGKPGLDAITGIVLHSDTPLASDFECSDPMVNRLFKNIVWTQRANFLDLPDRLPAARRAVRLDRRRADLCAHRDLQRGCGGVLHASGCAS